MTDFPKHTEDTAPADARTLLEQSEQAMGRIPGLHAVMAEAPGLLQSYQVAHNAVVNSSFDAEEMTVVWQSINVEHACHYCVPAHSGIARMMKVDASLDEALRDEAPLPNARLEALRTFTLEVVRQRGEVTEAQLDAFFEAGFTKRQVLEVVLTVGQKVMSNYTNHIAQTPVDDIFEKFRWTKTREHARRPCRPDPVCKT
jgi:alkylhydroperoxidase family enzyme